MEKLTLKTITEMIVGNTAQLQKRKKYGIIEIWTDK